MQRSNSQTIVSNSTPVNSVPTGTEISQGKIIVKYLNSSYSEIRKVIIQIFKLYLKFKHCKIIFTCNNNSSKLVQQTLTVGKKVVNDISTLRDTENSILLLRTPELPALIAAGSLSNRVIVVYNSFDEVPQNTEGQVFAPGFNSIVSMATVPEISNKNKLKFIVQTTSMVRAFLSHHL